MNKSATVFAIIFIAHYNDVGTLASYNNIIND